MTPDGFPTVGIVGGGQLARMMVDAVAARDFPMLQGGVLVVATLYVAVNTLTDAVTPMLDPRLRA